MVRAYKPVAGAAPEPVHKVKIRTEWRKGGRSVADKGGKDTVTFESVHGAQTMIHYKGRVW